MPDAVGQIGADRGHDPGAQAPGSTPSAVVHPHVGGFIEFADEIDWVAGNTSLNLCLDTGHLAYAGVDPAGAIRSYADRVAHVHFKDIFADVHAAVIYERIGSDMTGTQLSSGTMFQEPGRPWTISPRASR